MVARKATGYKQNNKGLVAAEGIWLGFMLGSWEVLSADLDPQVAYSD
jgi:hypothetical protein